MFVLYVPGLFFAANRVHASNLTFGRNVAEYHQLVEWLTVTSFVLWTVVLVTMLMRIVMHYVWYRYRYPLYRNNPPT